MIHGRKTQIILSGLHVRVARSHQTVCFYEWTALRCAEVTWQKLIGWAGKETVHLFVVDGVDALLLFLLLLLLSRHSRLSLCFPPVDRLQHSYTHTHTQVRLPEVSHAWTEASNLLNYNPIIPSSRIFTYSLDYFIIWGLWTLFLVLRLQRKKDAVVFVSVAVILCIHILHQLPPCLPRRWGSWEITYLVRTDGVTVWHQTGSDANTYAPSQTAPGLPAGLWQLQSIYSRGFQAPPFLRGPTSLARCAATQTRGQLLRLRRLINKLELSITCHDYW